MVAPLRSITSVSVRNRPFEESKAAIPIDDTDGFRPPRIVRDPSPSMLYGACSCTEYGVQIYTYSAQDISPPPLWTCFQQRRHHHSGCKSLHQMMFISWRTTFPFSNERLGLDMRNSIRFHRLRLTTVSAPNICDLLTAR